jgi:hypothetical protein
MYSIPKHGLSQREAAIRKSMIKKWLLLAAFIVITSLNDLTIIQGSPAYASNQSPLVFLKKWRLHWSWANETWGNNDKPYQETKADIDKALVQGQDLEKLLDKYKSAALDSPTNPVEQFRWAYLAYRISLLPQNQDKGVDKIGLSLEAMYRPVSPHSYEYDRLRFLMESYLTSNYELIGLGRRLIQRDPQNQDIQFYAIRNLSDPKDWGDRTSLGIVSSQKQALLLLQTFIQKYPTSSSGYNLLGGLYSEMYLKSNNPADRDHAVAALRQYQKMVALDSIAYQNAQFFIKKVQNGLVKYNGQYIYRETMPR